MNKNLENEYRAYAKQSTPDLWSRIEAALPEKKIVQMPQAQPIAQAQPMPQVMEQNTVQPQVVPMNDRQRRSDKRKIAMIRWSGIVAAAACLAIMIPVFLNLNRDRKDAAKDYAGYVGKPSADKSEAAMDMTDNAPTMDNAGDIAWGTEDAADGANSEWSTGADWEHSKSDDTADCDSDYEYLTGTTTEESEASDSAAENVVTQDGSVGEPITVKIQDLELIENNDELFILVVTMADGSAENLFVTYEDVDAIADAISSDDMRIKLVKTAEKYENKPIYRVSGY